MTASEVTYWLHKLLRSYDTKQLLTLTQKQASLIMAKKVQIDIMGEHK